jgi:hypothetical protein
MRRNVLLGSCLIIALSLAGCQDQRTDPTAPPAGTGAELNLKGTTLGRFGLNRNEVKLAASAKVIKEAYAEAARRAIDPGDYVCPPSTPVIDWFLGEVNEFIDQEPELFDLLYVNLLADLVPTYDALLFLTDATPQYFGYHGEYTQRLIKTEKDVKRFWDIASDDIQLIGMHGTMLQDPSRVAAVYEAAFGVPPDDAAFFASLVRDAVLQSQVLDGGNHPLFSFNAFAFWTTDGSIPPKIIMGDGVLAGYAAVGFDDVAPQAVYAHEFGHHIQNAHDYFNDPLATAGDPPEQTRYTELMADAYSAYYLTHKRGAALNQKRVEQFLQVFFQIGDCAFDNPGHHGTPNQRMAAAHFGFDLADQAQKQGHILSSAQFHDLFVAAYPGLVAPDATSLTTQPARLHSRAGGAGRRAE